MEEDGLKQHNSTQSKSILGSTAVASQTILDEGTILASVFHFQTFED